MSIPSRSNRKEGDLEKDLTLLTKLKEAQTKLLTAVSRLNLDNATLDAEYSQGFQEMGNIALGFCHHSGSLRAKHPGLCLQHLLNLSILCCVGQQPPFSNHHQALKADIELLGASFDQIPHQIAGSSTRQSPTTIRSLSDRYYDKLILEQILEEITIFSSLSDFSTRENFYIFSRIMVKIGELLSYRHFSYSPELYSEHKALQSYLRPFVRFRGDCVHHDGFIVVDGLGADDKAALFVQIKKLLEDLKSFVKGLLNIPWSPPCRWITGPTLSFPSSFTHDVTDKDGAFHQILYRIPEELSFNFDAAHPYAFQHHMTVLCELEKSLDENSKNQDNRSLTLAEHINASLDLRNFLAHHPLILLNGNQLKQLFEKDLSPSSSDYTALLTIMTTPQLSFLSCYEVGNSFMRLYRFREAADAFQKALSFPSPGSQAMKYQTADTIFLDQDVLLINTNLSYCLRMLQDVNPCLVAKQVETIYNSFSASLGDSYPDLSNDLSMTLVNVALLFSYRGEFEEACKFLKYALGCWRTGNLHLPSKGLIHHNIDLVSYQLMKSNLQTASGMKFSGFGVTLDQLTVKTIQNKYSDYPTVQFSYACLLAIMKLDQPSARTSASTSIIATEIGFLDQLLKNQGHLIKTEYGDAQWALRLQLQALKVKEALYGHSTPKWQDAIEIIKKADSELNENPIDRTTGGWYLQTALKFHYECSFYLSSKFQEAGDDTTFDQISTCAQSCFDWRQNQSASWPFLRKQAHNSLSVIRFNHLSKEKPNLTLDLEKLGFGLSVESQTHEQPTDPPSK